MSHWNMDPQTVGNRWLKLGWTLIGMSLVAVIPVVLAVLYIVYSFSWGYTLQNMLMYTIIGLEVLLFLAGAGLVVAGWVRRRNP